MQISSKRKIPIPNYKRFLEHCLNHHDMVEIKGLPIAVLGRKENFAVSIAGDKVHIRQTLGLFRSSLIVYTIEIDKLNKNFATTYFEINSVWLLFFSFVFTMTLLFPILILALGKIESKVFILVELYFILIFIFTLVMFKMESKKIFSFASGIISE